MRRRDILAGAAISTALSFTTRHLAWTQQALPVVGFLNTASAKPSERLLKAFQSGLAESGYVEGRDVLIEYRWADGDRARLKEMAGDLVGRGVNVLAATGGSPAALEAKAASSSIPIVFQIGVDPVEIGLVAGISRPGGNITGATMLAIELGSKRLELLRELLPRASTFAALLNPKGPGASIQLREMNAAAAKLGLTIHAVEATSENEIEMAFDRLSLMRVEALLIGADPLFNGLSEPLATQARRHRLPAIYQFREFVAAGGLISYGGSITDAYRQAGVYVGRILKGDKPSDLPVQQSTKLELIINMQTARMLGVDMPPSLLARADEVIE
jgi:putative tryptophan/tyrosine transport system substrate-binding protein